MSVISRPRPNPRERDRPRAGIRLRAGDDWYFRLTFLSPKRKFRFVSITTEQRTILCYPYFNFSHERVISTWQVAFNEYNLWTFYQVSSRIKITQVYVHAWHLRTIVFLPVFLKVHAGKEMMFSLHAEVCYWDLCMHAIRRIDRHTFVTTRKWEWHIKGS